MIAQVHILCGDEIVGRERAKQNIISSIKQLHENISSESFDPETDEFSSFMENLLTPSLFQDVRIFQVHRAHRLSDNDIKDFNNLLDNPPCDSYIIVEIDEEKKKNADYKAVKKFRIEKRRDSPDKKFVFLEFPKPPEYQVGQWLVQQVPALFKRAIKKADADFLVDLAGNDLSVLYSELQKIDTHLPPGKPVGRDIIEQIVGSSRQMTVFELAEALGKRQFPRALQIIDSLFNTSAFAPAIASVVFRHFWALYRIRCFANANPQVMKRFQNAKGFNNPDQKECGLAIGCAAGLLSKGEYAKVYPVMIASGIAEQAVKFTDQELEIIMEWLLEFDFGVKTGKVEGSQQDLQMLCYKISRVTELSRDGIAATDSR